MHEQLNRIERKLEDVSARIAALETADQLAVLNHTHLKEKVTKQENGQARVFWIVVTAAISFIVSFAFNGGFSFVPGS